MLDFDLSLSLSISLSLSLSLFLSLSEKYKHFWIFFAWIVNSYLPEYFALLFIMP